MLFGKYLLVWSSIYSQTVNILFSVYVTMDGKWVMDIGFTCRCACIWGKYNDNMYLG
jgi:hypothetical protein